MLLWHGRFSLILIALLAFLNTPLFNGEAPGQESPLFKSFAQEPKVKRPAPDFSLYDLKGEERGLKDLRGRCVLIHFWASWCEPCKAEFPALKRLSERFRDSGLEVIAIAEDSVERVEPFISGLGAGGAGFPVLIDRYGAVTRSYKVSVIPVSVVVNREGLIEGVLVGSRDYDSPEAIEYFESILR